MFNRFLKMQQDQLDSLSIEKQAQEQQRRIEQQRYDSLKYFHSSLSQYGGTSALNFQNRTAMQAQLSVLLDSQEQELVLSDLQLQAKQKEVLAQFGRVKGLQKVQKKQQKVKAQRERKQEQLQLDDWLNGSRRKG